MIKAFKRWLAKAAYEGLGEQPNISLAVKSKLGVQSDMFEKEKEAAQRQYQATQARGPVATQSRI